MIPGMGWTERPDRYWSACVECGNDEPTEGHDLCMDCLEATDGGPHGARVLLFSGGMDSFIAAHLWPADLLLYVALGHRYQDQELDTIADCGLDVGIDRRLYLGDLEREDAIIPLRNLYLAAIGSHYGDVIALGALAGEVNPDKTERFRVQASEVLTTCNAPSYWSAGRTIEVVYPLAQWTKAQLVRKYLDNHGDPEALVARTRSCYEATDLPCGWCAACVKRHIALALNGLSEATGRPPQESPHLDAIRERWDTYDPIRQMETRIAFPGLFPEDSTP